MGKRHLKKEEILAKIKHTQKLKNTGYKAAFTGMATIGNYILWKEYGFTQEELADYNLRADNYESRLTNEELSLEELSDRIIEIGGFPVRDVTEDYRPQTKKIKSFAEEIKKELQEADNQIIQMSTRYMTIHFNVLIDIGFSKEELNKNKDLINEKLATLPTSTGMRIMDLHKELIKEAGIFIEKPN